MAGGVAAILVVLGLSGVAAAASIARDDFDRTVTTGWGRSSGGDLWQHCAGDCPGYFSVDAGRGQVEVPAGRGPSAELAVDPVRDLSALVTFRVDRHPDAGGHYLALRTRVGDGSFYQGRIRIGTDGTARLSVGRAVNGSRTTLAWHNPELSVAAGVDHSLRFEAVGDSPTRLRVKLWRSDTAEPDWQLVQADSSPGLAEPGRFAIWSYLSSTAGNGPVVAAIDSVDLADHGLPSTPTEDEGAGSTTRPGPGNTGVPAGVDLRVHSGDLVITEPGTVVEGLEVRGFVHVMAPDVVIRNSWVRGGTASRDIGLVNVTEPGASLRITDSTLQPSRPSYRIDGIRGSNVTALRVEITATVDGLHIHGAAGDRSSGGNVLVADSWLHDFTYFSDVPNQSDGSHNDGIQVVGGRNITIRGNAITGARNAAIQVVDGAQQVSGLTIADNFVDGGACAINLAEKRDTFDGTSVTDNRVGANTRYRCGIIVDRSIGAHLSGNVWDEGGKATSVVYR